MALSSEEKEKRLEERRKQKYSNTHKIINGVDFKFCNLHYKYFSDEEPYFPSTTEYFYVNNTSKVDGLYPHCHRCGSQKAIQQWKDDPLKHREAHKRYEKTSKFKKWMRKNQEDMKEYRKDYRKTNKEKMKYYNEQHRNHDITENEWRNVQNYFEYICAYCGKTLEDQKKQNKEQFHKEHVEHDGYNDVRNCVCACTNCNSTKRKRKIQELFESGDIENFTQDKYDKIMLWCKEDYKQYIEDKPPYRIMKSRNYYDDGTYDYTHELWTVDEKRNVIECITTRNKRREIIKDIESGIIII